MATVELGEKLELMGFIQLTRREIIMNSDQPADWISCALLIVDEELLIWLTSQRGIVLQNHALKYIEIRTNEKMQQGQHQQVDQQDLEQREGGGHDRVKQTAERLETELEEVSAFMNWQIEREQHRALKFVAWVMLNSAKSEDEVDFSDPEQSYEQGGLNQLKMVIPKNGTSSQGHLSLDIDAPVAGPRAPNEALCLSSQLNRVSGMEGHIVHSGELYGDNCSTDYQDTLAGYSEQLDEVLETSRPQAERDLEFVREGIAPSRIMDTGAESDSASQNVGISPSPSPSGAVQVIARAGITTSHKRRWSDQVFQGAEPTHKRPRTQHIPGISPSASPSETVQVIARAGITTSHKRRWSDDLSQSAEPTHKRPRTQLIPGARLAEPDEAITTDGRELARNPEKVALSTPSLRKQNHGQNSELSQIRRPQQTKVTGTQHSQTPSSAGTIGSFLHQEGEGHQSRRPGEVQKGPPGSNRLRNLVPDKPDCTEPLPDNWRDFEASDFVNRYPNHLHGKILLFVLGYQATEDGTSQVKQPWTEKAIGDAIAEYQADLNEGDNKRKFVNLLVKRHTAAVLSWSKELGVPAAELRKRNIAPKLLGADGLSRRARQQRSREARQLEVGTNQALPESSRVFMLGQFRACPGGKNFPAARALETPEEQEQREREEAEEMQKEKEAWERLKEKEAAEVKEKGLKKTKKRRRKAESSS